MFAPVGYTCYGCKNVFFTIISIISWGYGELFFDRRRSSGPYCPTKMHVSSVNSCSLLNEYTQKHLANLVEITIQKAGATTLCRNKLLAFHYGTIEVCSFLFERTSLHHKCIYNWTIFIWHGPMCVCMHAWASPSTRRMSHWCKATFCEGWRQRLVKTLSWFY